MITLLALTPILLATATAPGAEPAAMPEEIIVITRKLDSIAANVGRDAKGRYHCSLSDTTGYPKLDEQLCKTTTKCVREAKGASSAVKACVAKRKPELLAEVRSMLAQRKSSPGPAAGGGV